VLSRYRGEFSLSDSQIERENSGNKRNIRINVEVDLEM
jgi:hypothetical protein